ncbi:hypothetical protein RFI_09915 [Reticulomyxa filosa]|uniref:Uncharacterized protein n=1 Tax=Reticulomyxa filosa TaxID=46433 RepID=X6NMG7_RETFI|nr:hypothetical protein RFI_09915 [Reticulomyxa filosa]|eukprot:ETO27216.1 hypothetical protein RFI_09915 [Reticulomyxa filosa]
MNTVPVWSRDSCSFQNNNLTCAASMCNDTLQACAKNAKCLELANATTTYENYYAGQAGCSNWDEKCKNEHKVFLKALNDSLPQYCWGQNNTVACSLYESAVSCVASNCSTECNDCGLQCQTYLVSCMFDANCSVALNWLLTEIDTFSNSTDPFFPYELEADKNEYCNATETSKYCNSKFDTLWNCLSSNCLHQRCLYTTCNAQAQNCYGDQECQDELFALIAKYPALTDLTPGLFQTLADYYCTTDKNLSCSNANFTALLNCYGTKCCWDTDVCKESNGLKDWFVEKKNCLKEACVEVHCLPAVQDCMKDTGCSDALVAQGQWDHFCDQCISDGNSADYCTSHGPINCSAMDNSSAILYMQQYCWEHTCSARLTNVVQCSLLGCVDCNLTKSLNQLASTDLPVTTSILEKLDFNPCECTLYTCWNALSQCFLDQTCWDLFFSDKEGYGFKYIIESIIGDLNNTVTIMPSYVDSQIRNGYCSNKDCNDNFWNVLSCMLSPIYLGDDYYPGCANKDYFQNKIVGCGIGEMFYTEMYPECVTKKCFGFVNDCGADFSSPCYKTLSAAITHDEWNNCVLCNNCSNCYDDSDTFKTNYLKRCANDGSNCTLDYDNLANCVYQECTGGKDTLPGSKSTVCNTSSASMHSGVIVLIFSVLLVFLSL